MLLDALLALKGNGEVPKEDIDQLIEHLNEGN